MYFKTSILNDNSIQWNMSLAETWRDLQSTITTKFLILSQSANQNGEDDILRTNEPEKVSFSS